MAPAPALDLTPSHRGDLSAAIFYQSKPPTPSASSCTNYQQRTTNRRLLVANEDYHRLPAVNRQIVGLNIPEQ